jgi:hypothetical protein
MEAERGGTKNGASSFDLSIRRWSLMIPPPTFSIACRNFIFKIVISTAPPIISV